LVRFIDSSAQIKSSPIVPIIPSAPTSFDVAKVPVAKKSFWSHFWFLRFLKSWKFWLGFLIVLLIISASSYLGIVRPGLTIYDQIKVAKIDAEKLKGDAGAQNIVSADHDLDQLNSDVTEIQHRFSYFSWSARIPLISGYYSDGNNIISAASNGVAAGKIISTSLLPFSDVLGLQGSGNTTADEKLQKAVEILPKLAPKTEEVAAKLTMVNDEIQAIDVNRYPGKLAGIDIQESLKSGQDLVKLINEFMPQAKDVFTYAPTALGSNGSRTYMVIFQNDKELRPSGGFLTAYTFATFDKGKLTTSKTDDIYNLDQSITSKPTAPTPILKYLPLVPKWNLRDTNLSPDFVESMNNFESLYKKSPQYKSNAGYIGADTYLLQDLLRLTGPVKTKSTGDTFTADNVVPKLETYAEKVFTNVPNRKGFLGDLMKEVIARLSSAKSDQWPNIINTMLAAANEKHVLFYSKDPSVEALIEKYDWAGRINGTTEDYLHVNNSNFAGAKSNLYIQEKIIQDITITEDGTVSKKVTVQEIDPVKTDGWLNGPYRDWVRMFVPKGSSLQASSGGEVKTATTADQLGKTMFENFLIAHPLGSTSSDTATWSVSYQLPTQLTGHTYKLLVQKQPGTAGPWVVININGKQLINEQLKTDKDYSLSF
jgi:Protein of unknown function (DUF4012)